jgi:hypothetical protein
MTTFPPPTPEQYPPQPPPWRVQAARPEPPKKKRWPWVVGGIIGVIVLGSALSPDGDTTAVGTVVPPSAQNAPGVPSGVDPQVFDANPAEVPGGLRVETRVIPPPAPVETGPLTTFSDGTYKVGNGDGQVPAGAYKSTGPSDGETYCYYKRLRNNDGSDDDIIDNDLGKGPAILIVQATDGYVVVSGCTFTQSG